MSIGVVGTRLMMQQGAENPSPTPTLPASSVSGLTLYDGAMIPISASHAVGKCSQGGESRADMPPDNRADTVWRCPGAGVGEMVSLTLRPGTELVGVRIINGDTTGQDYRVGCRTSAVRWTSSGGSWAVQPLDVSHPGNQEVRLPLVATDDVLMTVLSTTEPGSPETTANAAAVSHVELLGRSQGNTLTAPLVPLVPRPPVPSGLFMFACAVRPANTNKPSKPTVGPADR